MNDKQEKLKSMLEEYIVPTFDSVSRFQARNYRKISRLTKGRGHFTSTQIFYKKHDASIEHKSMLYTSRETSQLILNENRSTFKKLMKTLNEYEARTYRDNLYTAQQVKKKLEFFRSHSKPATFAKTFGIQLLSFILFR